MAFEELESAASDMDIERIEAVFEEMDDYGMPAKKRGLYESIRDAASEYDYDRILELLKCGGH